ncbi:MAG: MFS transporter, partial [Dehalococcoidia bacterium]
TAATQPARTALLPSLVPRGNLVNAVALHSTIFQTSQVTGPALAGAAIATVGLGPAYLLNGVLFLAAMAAIIAVRVPMPSRETYEDPWRSFTHGMAFVRSRPVIISLLVLDLGQTILGSYRALLPIFAEMLGAGPAGYGVLSAAPGVGSVVGAVVILALGDMKYKGLYTVFAILGYCVALVVLAQAPWFLLAVVAAGLLGTANSVQVIPRNSVILALSPAGLRGRVEAFRTMLSGGGPPIGYAFSGAMAAMMGAPLALVVGGIACAVLVAGLGIVHRELRDPDLGATTRVPT